MDIGWTTHAGASGCRRKNHQYDDKRIIFLPVADFVGLDLNKSKLHES
jgi:hypothetical protein